MLQVVDANAVMAPFSLAPKVTTTTPRVALTTRTDPNSNSNSNTGNGNGGGGNGDGDGGGVACSRVTVAGREGNNNVVNGDYAAAGTVNSKPAWQMQSQFGMLYVYYMPSASLPRWAIGDALGSNVLYTYWGEAAAAPYLARSPATVYDRGWIEDAAITVACTAGNDLGKTTVANNGNGGDPADGIDGDGGNADDDDLFGSWSTSTPRALSSSTSRQTTAAPRDGAGTTAGGGSSRANEN